MINSHSVGLKSMLGVSAYTPVVAQAESAMSTAERALGAIVREAGAALEHLQVARTAGEVGPTLAALAVLLQIGNHAGASGGIQSNVHVLDEAAGRIAALQEIGALQAAPDPEGLLICVHCDCRVARDAAGFLRTTIGDNEICQGNTEGLGHALAQNRIRRTGGTGTEAVR